jgi:hypothetical protein
VGLTTLPPSNVDCLEIQEPQHLGQSRPVMGMLYIYLVGQLFFVVKNILNLKMGQNFEIKRL